MSVNWYVVQVMSGWENKVKNLIEKRIPMDNMQDVIKQILVPTENVSEVKAGKKKVIKRKFFPGYILVEMDITDEAYYFINDINGVIRISGERQPVPLQDYEIEGILNQVEGKKEKVQPKISFVKGESVKVIDGPFVNFNGEIVEVNPDKGKLKAMIFIFGRETPAELEYWQVEKV